MAGAGRSQSGGVVVIHDVQEPVIVRPPDPNPDITKRFDRYDVLGQTWTQLASMNAPRAGHAIHNHQDRVIAIGGTDGSTIYKSTEYYDVDGEDEWNTGTSMSVARSYFQSVYQNGKIYVFGGVAANGFGNLTITTSCEVYDCDSDTWTAITSMPNGVAMGIAAVSGSTVYVLCGYSGSIGILNGDIQRYDIDTDTWLSPVTIAAGDLLLYQRLLPFAFIDSNTIYVINGLRFSFDAISEDVPTMLFSAFSYIMGDTSIDRSERLFQELPKERFAGASASIGDEHFCIGGADEESNTLRIFESIDSSASPFTYTPETKMVNGRSSFGATSTGSPYGDFIYVSGGVISHNNQNYLRVMVDAVPESIRLDGKQTGAIEVQVADENGDFPAEVLVRVYTQYSASDGSNVVLFTQDDVTVTNGYGMTTLLPRSEDSAANMVDGSERSYTVGVYGVVIDDTYIGESNAVNPTPPTGSGGGVSGGGSSVGDIVIPPEAEIFATYSTVITPDNATTGSVLNLGFLSSYLSFKPIADNGRHATVNWYSDIEWLPVVSSLIDDNEGTYERIRDALDRMSRQDTFGGSVLLDAIKTAGDIVELDSTSVNKMLYLHTDGDDNCSRNTIDSALSQLDRAVPGNGLPVVSSAYRVVPFDLHLDQSIRDGSALLEQFALVTNGTVQYLTSDDDLTEHIASIIKTRGFAGYGVFTFQVDLLEECRIESLQGLFDVDNVETFAFIRYAIGDNGGNFGLFSDRVDANETVTLFETEGRYVRFQVEFIAAMTTDVYCGDPLTAPQLNQVNVTYHLKTISHLFITPETPNEVPHQVMVTLDAVRGRGSDVTVAANTQHTGTWEDYSSPARPAVDNGTKIVIPIRQPVDTEVTYTLEPLLSIDGFIFEAQYGKWADDSSVKVYASTGSLIPATDYKAFPHKGYIVFNRKRAEEFILSVENREKLSVAAEIINRVNGDPVKIYGGGFIYSTLGLRQLSQSGTVLPEALNLLITPLKPNLYATFRANYAYYDLRGRTENGTVLKWYVNDVEQADLQDLREWENGTWQIAKDGDQVYFTVQPKNAKATGRLVKSIPVRIEA